MNNDRVYNNIYKYINFSKTSWVKSLESTGCIKCALMDFNRLYIISILCEFWIKCYRVDFVRISNILKIHGTNLTKSIIL